MPVTIELDDRDRIIVDRFVASVDRTVGPFITVDVFIDGNGQMDFWLTPAEAIALADALNSAVEATR